MRAMRKGRAGNDIVVNQYAWVTELSYFARPPRTQDRLLRHTVFPAPLVISCLSHAQGDSSTASCSNYVDRTCPPIPKIVRFLPLLSPTRFVFRPILIAKQVLGHLSALRRRLLFPPQSQFGVLKWADAFGKGKPTAPRRFW